MGVFRGIFDNAVEVGKSLLGIAVGGVGVFSHASGRWFVARLRHHEPLALKKLQVRRLVCSTAGFEFVEYGTVAYRSLNEAVRNCQITSRKMTAT